jgi:hypothetical protein
MDESPRSIDLSNFFSVYDIPDFYLTLKESRIHRDTMKSYTVNTTPFQMYSCFKNYNKGKLHSHYIFFSLFC